MFDRLIIDDLRTRLFVSSALMLFTEIALIRWLGENVLYLSFFTNLILLASFLGIGIGFLRASDDLPWFQYTAHLLLVTIGFVTVFPIDIDRSAEDVLFLGNGEVVGLPVWIVLPLVFVLTAAVLAAIGHGVARTFRELGALTAYRIDIAGSLTGVALFSFMSWLSSPPVVWALVICGAFLILMGSQLTGPQVIASAGVIIILGIQSFATGYQWSPYYEIYVEEGQRTASINVNGIPHQTMSELDYLDAIGSAQSRTFEMLEITDPERVLIIGAGTGNDVAYSIRAGAAQIDAVEIDPVIYQTGLRLHPEAPYKSDAVDIHVDDGRAFMESSEESYDLILFAITDSLTNVSGRSNLRLESFLFTQESISRARELLTDNGIVAVYHTYSDPWVIERMGRTFQEAFQQEPCFRRSPGVVGGVTIAAGDIEEVCSSGERRDFQAGPAPSTDDHPFLYLKSRGIPSFYLGSIAALLIVSVGAIGAFVSNPGSMRRYADLFFLGAAFLLLETKGVVQFSLWFGNTWVVNALVFGSILVSVLLAIEVAERRKAPPIVLMYLLLAVALGVAWATPVDALLSLGQIPRLLAAAGLLFIPVFAANLIFAERFRDTAQTTVAFGANLLGAMVGGVLEYLSLAIGYRALTLVVMALYGAAFLSWRIVRSR